MYEFLVLIAVMVRRLLYAKLLFVKTHQTVNNTINNFLKNDMENISLYKIENLPKTNEKNVSEAKTNMFMTQKNMNIIFLMAFAIIMPISLLKAQAPDKSKIRIIRLNIL